MPVFEELSTVFTMMSHGLDVFPSKSQRKTVIKVFSGKSLDFPVFVNCHPERVDAIKHFRESLALGLQALLVILLLLDPVNIDAWLVKENFG